MAWKNREGVRSEMKERGHHRWGFVWNYSVHWTGIMKESQRDSWSNYGALFLVIYFYSHRKNVFFRHTGPEEDGSQPLDRLQRHTYIYIWAPNTRVVILIIQEIGRRAGRHTTHSMQQHSQPGSQRQRIPGPTLPVSKISTSPAPTASSKTHRKFIPKRIFHFFVLPGNMPAYSPRTLFAKSKLFSVSIAPSQRSRRTSRDTSVALDFFRRESRCVRPASRRRR